MKVRVKQGKQGFYGGKRRRSGDEFEILNESHIGRWMIVVERPKAAEKQPQEESFDYRAEADRLGVPMIVDGKKVHHHTLRKQVEIALAQEVGE